MFHFILGECDGFKTEQKKMYFLSGFMVLTMFIVSDQEPI